MHRCGAKYCGGACGEFSHIPICYHTPRFPKALSPSKRCVSRSLTRIAAQSFRRQDDPLTDGRRRALDFRWWLDPGTWSFPTLLPLEIDRVMNAALLVEPLQIGRQQGRLRRLHRLGCWSRRSSHGRDHSGYRPCTLTPRPAPKSTTTLCDIGGVLPSYCFSGNGAAKFSKKSYASGPPVRRTRPLASLTRRAGFPACSPCGQDARPTKQAECLRYAVAGTPPPVS
jgi:hypothetical protein